MKDLDARLRSGAPRPHRKLRANFTTTTLAVIEEGKKEPRYRPKWKEYIQVKILHKPLVATAAFAATLIIGGSAYAAVGGISGIRALFSGETTLANGDRIVKVDTQECPHIDAFNITNKARTSHDPIYYRIKAASKLTNSQVVDIVQGTCAADAEGQLGTSIMADIQNRPENKNQLVGGYANSVVTALSPTQLTVSYDMPVAYTNGVTQYRHATQTFTHIDPNAVVIYSGAKYSLSTLKVGDHIGITYRATGDALAHSETTAPDQVNTDEATVVVVSKLSKTMQDYYAYQRYNGSEFERVAPCDKDPSGYCDAATYLDQK